MNKAQEQVFFEQLRQAWCEVRERTGLSQRAAAEEAGISQGALSQWERGETTTLRPESLTKVLNTIDKLNEDLPEDKRVSIPVASATAAMVSSALAGGVWGTALGAAAGIGAGAMIPRIIPVIGALTGAAYTLKSYRDKKSAIDAEPDAASQPGQTRFVCPHPKCGAVVPGPAEGATFCVACGGRLASKCSNCGALCAIVDANYCPNCGSEISQH